MAALGSLLISWHLAGPHPDARMSAILGALAAVAMGLQSAAVLRLHAGPATTYVTGTLTTFATEAIRRLHLVKAARRMAPEPRIGPYPGAHTRTFATLARVRNGLRARRARGWGSLPPSGP